MDENDKLLKFVGFNSQHAGKNAGGRQHQRTINDAEQNQLTTCWCRWYSIAGILALANTSVGTSFAALRRKMHL